LDPGRVKKHGLDPEQTCLYASLRVLAYRNHIHGGYVLDVATLTAGKKHDRLGQLLSFPNSAVNLR
jgi:hypothetical protein